MDKISIIIPCYNEEKALPIFFEEMKKVELKDFTNVAELEYIIVNDGSKDKTLDIIKSIKKENENVRYISFSRNFGKEAAMYAGLKYSTGDYVTIIDADLQDPPSLLKKMYDMIKTQEYDIIGTRRKNRKGEPILKSIFSILFYKFMNRISDVEVVDGARDYKLMTRKVVDSIISFGEYNRYSKGLMGAVGYNTKWIEYNNVKRVAGKSKWSFWKLFRYAIEAITSFSTAPLMFASFLGILFCIVAFIAILVIIIKTLVFGDPTTGWPSLACIITFIGGVQLFAIGIIGQYLAKTYLEVKNRPIYIIKETEKDE
jgi:glycosyltransferase involved in cell wall biosynthesis